MKTMKTLMLTLMAAFASAMFLSAPAVAKEVNATLAANPTATTSAIGAMNLPALPDQAAAEMKAGAYLTLTSPFPTNGTGLQKLRYATCMAQLRLGNYTPMCNIY